MNLRNEALLLLDRRGAILEVAREVSRRMGKARVRGAVIGGVAVVLQGHLRTTGDVNILVDPPLKRMRDLLTAHGFVYDRAAKEFVKRGVSVHLVAVEQAWDTCVIDGITTVSLPRLIEIKLRSGLADPLQAQDIADVIGLVRHRGLRVEFAAQIEKSLRAPFRKIVRQIARATD